MQKVLVFHIGQLGDSLMILPALKVLRNFFEEAEFTLLSDKTLGKKYVSAQQVFENTGYFDRYISFPKTKKFNALWQFVSLLFLLPRLRLAGFDKLAYLVPSRRSKKQVERDLRLFRLCGIRDIYGMDGFFMMELATSQARPPVHEADLILARLKMDGLSVPEVGAAKFDLKLTQAEEKFVTDWLAANAAVIGGCRLVAFAPGSKMQAKRWDLRRYTELGKLLIEKYDVFPIVFGGIEDAALGRQLTHSWGRGLNAAGALTVRQAAAALRRCDFYVGNDTGTMHMAAAVGTRCFAIFSARDVVGKWHPYGPGHVVFRSEIECQGCLLETCDHVSCLTRISPETVFARIDKELIEATEAAVIR